MNIAIITGASSGLGTEYYKVIQDEVLDEVWIIARREGALNEISQKYGKIKTRVIPLDLTVDESHEKLLNIIKEEKPNIKYLFNNAGFGAYGKLDEIDLLKQTNMIDLNVKALTKIT
ncbi:MAG: SDR family NAD(P)-dependent oxidoreductase, partial [Clostridia bacterium]|nr:SDR family NAD(P)-dependent oxidoreductase [Clostridia bacterium]